jgi:hypothetical protein
MTSRSSTAAPILAVLAVVLVLGFYVLSVGPALRLAIRCAARPGPDDARPMQVFHVLYKPLFSAAKATKTESALREYVRRWE